MDGWMGEWMDEWKDGWMNGWIDWLSGQLDNRMNRCTKYFRIFEATTEQSRRKNITKMGTDTCSCRSRRRRRVFGPGQKKNLCRHNFRHFVYKLKVCPIRRSVRSGSLSHVASIFPYTSKSSAKLLKINIKTKLLEHWLCAHFIFCWHFVWTRKNNMKIQINVTFLCMALVCLVSVMLLTQTRSVAAGTGDGHCKELSKRGKCRERSWLWCTVKCTINVSGRHKVDHQIALNYSGLNHFELRNANCEHKL